MFAVCLEPFHQKFLQPGPRLEHLHHHLNHLGLWLLQIPRVILGPSLPVTPRQGHHQLPVDPQQGHHQLLLRPLPLQSTPLLLPHCCQPLCLRCLSKRAAATLHSLYAFSFLCLRASSLA